MSATAAETPDWLHGEEAAVLQEMRAAVAAHAQARRARWAAAAEPAVEATVPPAAATAAGANGGATAQVREGGAPGRVAASRPAAAERRAPRAVAAAALVLPGLESLVDPATRQRELRR